MSGSYIKADVLNPGEAEAEILVLGEPLSFWGGFDPSSGEIIDQHHPQAGCSVAGKLIVMPSSRGSAGTPAGVAESIRRETAPAAVVLASRDVNIAIGAMVALELYGKSIPVLAVAETDYARLKSRQTAKIDADGTIRL